MFSLMFKNLRRISDIFGITYDITYDIFYYDIIDDITRRGISVLAKKNAMHPKAHTKGNNNIAC